MSGTVESQRKRDLLVSIRPVYADQILGGYKTVELRRRFSEAATGSLILIYSTSPTCAIIGYAKIRAVVRTELEELWTRFGSAACIDRPAFNAYFDGLGEGYAILLEDVRALERQVAAADLKQKFGFVAPQSFMYLRQEYYSLLDHEHAQTPH